MKSGTWFRDPHYWFLAITLNGLVMATFWILGFKPSLILCFAVGLFGTGPVIVALRRSTWARIEVADER